MKEGSFRMVIVLLQRNNRVDNIPLINNILLEKQWSKLHQTAGTGKALVACVCVCRFYFTFAFGTATSPASCNTDYCIKLVTIKDLLNLGLNLLISNDKKKKTMDVLLLLFCAKAGYLLWHSASDTTLYFIKWFKKLTGKMT